MQVILRQYVDKNTVYEKDYTSTLFVLSTAIALLLLAGSVLPLSNFLLNQYKHKPL